VRHPVGAPSPIGHTLGALPRRGQLERHDLGRGCWPGQLAAAIQVRRAVSTENGLDFAAMMPLKDG